MLLFHPHELNRLAVFQQALQRFVREREASDQIMSPAHDSIFERGTSRAKLGDITNLPGAGASQGKVLESRESNSSGRQYASPSSAYSTQGYKHFAYLSMEKSPEHSSMGRLSEHLVTPILGDANKAETPDSSESHFLRFLRSPCSQNINHFI